MLGRLCAYVDSVRTRVSRSTIRCDRVIVASVLFVFTGISLNQVWAILYCDRETMKWINFDLYCDTIRRRACYAEREREREKTGPRRPGRDCLLRISERRDRLWERNRTLATRLPGVIKDPQILSSLVCLQPSVLDRGYTLDRVALESYARPGCVSIRTSTYFWAHPVFISYFLIQARPRRSCGGSLSRWGPPAWYESETLP